MGLVAHQRIEQAHDVLDGLTDNIMEIVSDPAFAWKEGVGPAGIVVVVLMPRLDAICSYYGALDVDPSERPPAFDSWPPFVVIAVMKGMISLSEGKPSEECTPIPALGAHQSGDPMTWRNWPGGVTHEGYAVGASGLNGAGDKKVSNLILPAIIGADSVFQVA